MSVGVSSNLLAHEDHHQSYRDQYSIGILKSNGKKESVSGLDRESEPPASPYYVGRIIKPVFPQNPLHLSIERKAKRNKEIYVKN